MSLKKKRAVLLWFHTNELSQEAVQQIADAFPTQDVRFRKVVRDVGRDILETFDALGGDVPQRYLNEAAMRGIKVSTLNGEDISDAPVPVEPKPAAAAAPTASPAPTVAPPVPTDAPKPSVTSVPPPAK